MSRIVRAASTVLVVLALILGSGSVASAEAKPANFANATAFGDADGIHVVSATTVDARLIDFVLETAALAAPVHVRVLVPADYTAHPTRRYPSIYLLHGCSAGGSSSGLEYLDWSGLGAEQITAHAEAIVVMPEGGAGGFYTDWVNGGAGGPPMWETFHLSQLVPWVDHVFRTISKPSERAIAGLSMGGFGSLSYASRHPDVFGEAASFSGAADLTYPADQTEPTSSLVVAACALSDGGGRDSTFGPHTTDELNWRAHDPARLTRNLSNTALYLYTGNGQPGPLDRPGAGVDQIEVLAHAATVEFHSQLVAQGIPSFFDDYGPGTHTGPYWTRDFADVLPRFMADFAAHRAAPAQFTYLTADPAYTVWGWRVHVHRAAGEFSALHADGAGGFALLGSGSAIVVTAAIYRPGSTRRVVVRAQSATSTETIRADSHGRLRIAVLLGPANPYQEYTDAAIAAGTRVFTTHVTIS